MEHKVFGMPQPGVTYRDRPGAYGIAFGKKGNVDTGGRVPKCHISALPILGHENGLEDISKFKEVKERKS